MKTVFILAAFVGILSTGCSKQPGMSRMTVKLTDAPGDFQEVNVEIRRVEVHYIDSEGGNSGWVSLKTNAGLYDLLLLQNDLTAVLAAPYEIPAGKINQMRLVLGENNFVKVDDVYVSLDTPSGSESGLKIDLHASLSVDHHYEVLIDFDAAQSIVLQGNGSYLLKPVIRVKNIEEI